MEPQIIETPKKRILTIGDVHFKVSNIPLVNIFIEKLRGYLENLKEKNELPDLIIVLGDVLDTHEKLHTIPFNKACNFFDMLREYRPLYVLVGNHDMCVDPHTLVLLFSGQVKPAWQIKIGDILQGDSGTLFTNGNRGIHGKRTVLNTYKGIGKMYKVNQPIFDTSYTVSENHLLVLVKHMLIYFYKGECYVEWLEYSNDQFKMNVEKMVHVPIHVRESIFPNKKFVIEIPVSRFVLLPDSIKSKLYGIRFDPDTVIGNRNVIHVSPIIVQEIGYANYVGFTVDGNNKFLLADNTVCHNSSNQNFLNENHWMNVFKKWDNITVCDTVIKYDNMVFCPYVPPGKFIDALNTVNDWETSDCIFAHQEFRNCKMGAIESRDGDLYSENLPMVISGHIHGRDRLAENIYYTGCALPLSDNDRNTIAMITVNKDPTIIENNSGRVEIEEIDLNLPKRENIYSDVKNIRRDIKKKINKISQEDLLNGLCRLTIGGSYEKFRSFKLTREYRELIEKGVKVKYIERIERKGEVQPKNHTNFRNTLWDLVSRENDPFLEKIYHEVIIQ
jgi:hypothetical protein